MFFFLEVGPMKPRSLSIAPAIAAFCLLISPATSWGQFVISLDTTKLPPLPTADDPYVIEFQFNLGGASLNNSVTISNIMLGGGSAGSLITSPFTGSVTGDLGSQIVLSGNPNGDDFLQEFTAGSILQFTVSMTNLPQPGSQGDTFSFFIDTTTDNDPFDNLNNVPTNAPYGINTLVTAVTDPLGQAPISPIPYSILDSDGNPILTPDVTVTPAPSSVVLLLTGASALLLLRRAIALLRSKTAIGGVV
jgi:hypothetical protein